jgi:glutamate-1-semialdehyde 2,1-aminomutase
MAYTINQCKMGITSEAALEESQSWFKRARRVLAGGISSSARATSIGRLDFPLYIVQGQGSRVWDANGNEYIDYLLGYGSAILGHAHSGQAETLKTQLDQGTMFGTCNTVEVELAEQIVRMVPCAELVRFGNSGSEAIQGAVRGARGYAGRSKILKFEGHYHGWVDALSVSTRPERDTMGPLESPHSVIHSRGIPTGIVEDVIVCPWNEPEILRGILNAHKGEIAAIIAEPIVANNACIMPKPGYLEMLREECTRRGIVLIFDEIVTGFRVAPGGAQELFGVKPDMAVFSKALGGGLSISALAGSREIMDLIATNKVRHGGTYNGNPLCAASALYTLRAVAVNGFCARLQEAGRQLMDAIEQSAEKWGVRCTVQGRGSMFQVVFGLAGRPIWNYRDLLEADMKRQAAFRQALLEQGVHVNNSGLACWFLSMAHSPEDIEITTSAIDKAFQAIRG